MATDTLVRRDITTVLYDGQCPLCRRSVAILKPLDWGRRLAFVDCRDPNNWPPTERSLEMKRLLEEMHVVSADGQTVTSGFKGFRTIAGRLALLWPLYPFLFLPGVPMVGQKVYLWVAKNRFDLVPCSDGQCQVRLPNQR